MTQTVVIVSASDEVRARLTGLHVVVEGSAGQTTEDDYVLAVDRIVEDATGLRFPFQFPIAPLDGEASRIFRVTITGLDGSGSRIVARAISGFERGQSRRLDLFLDTSCLDVFNCSNAQTCRVAACVPARIPIVELPAYEVATNATAAPDAGWDAGRMDAATDAGADAARIDAGMPGEIVGLTAGYTHACALRSTGEVRCWGTNTYGELGDGTVTQRLTPVAVTGLSDAVEVAAGSRHTCARRSTGAVSCWGNNADGQLGDGSSGVGSVVPVPVTDLSDAVELVAGGSHTCARRTSGEVVCWGYNRWGQLGDGTDGYGSISRTPVQVRGAPNPVQISAGEDQTCALLSGGEVRGWGWNGAGELGDGTTENRLMPVAVSGLTDAEEVRARWYHMCARRTNGTIRCWGESSGGGSLGDGTTNNSLTPVDVLGVSDAAAITVGRGHSCSVLRTGQALCWGSNRWGQLGDGTVTARTTPVPVMGLSDVAEISASSGFTCARRSAGQVLCWGRNGGGQLGDGTTTDRLSPVPVVGL